MSETKQPIAGVGFLGLLTLLFVGLKLAGVISWGWWLVLLPLYGPFAAALLLLVPLLVLAAIFDRRF